MGILEQKERRKETGYEALKVGVSLKDKRHNKHQQLSLLSMRLWAISMYSSLIFVPFSSAISPVALRRFIALRISP